MLLCLSMHRGSQGTVGQGGPLQPADGQGEGSHKPAQRGAACTEHNCSCLDHSRASSAGARQVAPKGLVFCGSAKAKQEAHTRMRNLVP